jgi:UDP-N-acetylglucosamine acyltransferase
MNIHPTAVVDPEAEFGPDVVVGPYCVIGRDVTIGAGCWLQNHVTICGPVKIGPGNRFHSFCSIGQQTQDLKYSGEPTYLEIGEGNCFREFVTVNRATAVGSVTRVGNHGNFLAYSHIAHDCVVEDRVIFSNNGTLAGHVLVQAHAIIGGLTAIHQFCRIGKHAITGGCSKIVQDVPPFMIADGNPAMIRGVNVVGLERHGLAADIIRDLKEAYRILYRSGLNTKQAIEELGKNFAGVAEVRELIEFIEKSERGIVRG